MATFSWIYNGTGPRLFFKPTFTRIFTSWSWQDI